MLFNLIIISARYCSFCKVTAAANLFVWWRPAIRKARISKCAIVFHWEKRYRRLSGYLWIHFCGWTIARILRNSFAFCSWRTERRIYRLPVIRLIRASGERAIYFSRRWKSIRSAPVTGRSSAGFTCSDPVGWSTPHRRATYFSPTFFATRSTFTFAFELFGFRSGAPHRDRSGRWFSGYHEGSLTRATSEHEKINSALSEAKETSARVMHDGKADVARPVWKFALAAKEDEKYFLLIASCIIKKFCILSLFWKLFKQFGFN